MVAAVANEDPQMEPKPAQAPTDAMAIPPLRCPNQLSAALNKDVDIPPSVENCPINRKSGTMDKE